MLGHERGQKGDAGHGQHVLKRAGSMPGAVFFECLIKEIRTRDEKDFFLLSPEIHDLTPLTRISREGISVNSL